MSCQDCQRQGQTPNCWFCSWLIHIGLSRSLLASTYGLRALEVLHLL